VAKRASGEKLVGEDESQKCGILKSWEERGQDGIYIRSKSYRETK
jgi:hypothetical protein